MSTLKTTNIQHASAANPAIVLAADGTAAATVSGINGGPLAGFRNAIINGNFDVWQRGVADFTSGYTADRWKIVRIGTTCSASRQPFTLGQSDVPGEPTYFYRIAVTSIAGAGNVANLQQPIESVRTFAGQQVVVSFWAKADAAKPISVELRQEFGTSGSPSSQVTAIGVTKTTLSTSWQKVTVTAAVPSISGKTTGSDQNDSLDLLIWFDAGSNFNSRTNSLGQQSGTFDIAQVQVEPGPVATPFECRPIGIEQRLCYRYYYVAAGGNEAGANSSSFYASGTTGAWFAGILKHPVTMRANPNRSTDTPVYVNCSSLNVANGNVNFTRYTILPAAAGRYTVSWTETILDAEL